MRINVIGTSGSGKSTLAKRIAEKLDIPYIELDELFWKPNWTESTDEEFFPKVARAVSGEDHTQNCAIFGSQQKCAGDLGECRYGMWCLGRGHRGASAGD